MEQFEGLLPLAADWAAEQEQLALRKGVPLTEQEIADAKAAGVRDPERVRVLEVDTIPAPSHPVLKAAYNAIDFAAAPRGLALQYGIFMRSDCREDRHILAHEFAHISQYERLGGILPFLRGYIYQCATIGYREAPLEKEASEIAQRVCSS